MINASVDEGNRQRIFGIGGNLFGASCSFDDGGLL